MTPRADTDAIVVGAGIGGTAFALLAARRGWRILILEREPARISPVRPEILWGPTVDTFDAMEVGARFRDEAAIRLRALEARTSEGRRMLRLAPEESGAAGASPWATEPGTTRAILLDAALATGRVEHRAGSEVTGLLHEVGRVRGVVGKGRDGSFALRAPLVVGDDGDRSAVRRAMGVKLVAESFPMEFILARASRPADVPEDEARAYFDAAGFARDIVGALLVPLGRRALGVVAIGRIGAFARLSADPPGSFEDQLRSALPDRALPSFEFKFPQGFVKAVRPYGQAESYWRPGVALLGDAAHPVSPVGGQGANMSVADAQALADAVLPTTLPGETPAGHSLSAYESRRRAANERSIAFSRRGAAVWRALWAAPALARALPPLLRALDRSPRRKAALLRSLSTAFQGAPPHAER